MLSHIGEQYPEELVMRALVELNLIEVLQFLYLSLY